jgi:hypothetical protein
MCFGFTYVWNIPLRTPNYYIMYYSPPVHSLLDLACFESTCYFSLIYYTTNRVTRHRTLAQKKKKPPNPHVGLFIVEPHYKSPRA